MKKNSPSRLLLAASALVLVACLGLLWLVVTRENQRRDLLLEYEAFRASSAIVDEYRRDETFTPASDAKVLGFGFYTLDGSSVRTYGKAPDSLDLASLPKAREGGSGSPGFPGNVSVSFSAGGASIRLVRSSGTGGGGPGRMMGGAGGMRPGMGRSRQGQGYPGPVLPAAPPPPQGLSSSFSVPYYTWIEYSAKGYSMERLELRLAAVIISLALAGFYFLLLRSFRRNEALQARAIETRELIQLGEAARTLVHEIRNPLGIMRIQTAKLRRATRAASISESAEAIEGEILRLSNLADRIRDFLKSGQAKLEPIELRDFLARFVDRYGDLGDSGIALELELPAAAAPPSVAEADSDKLITALDDLLRNAIEAVAGQPEGKRRISIRLSGAERSWRLTVSDSGPGVPADVVGRIFDPFFTTKEKGSGIGLPLARSLVEACGGNLDYKGGQKGEGAVFVITLRAV